MTADGPHEYSLYKLNGLKWANKDIELETSSGLVPFIYSGKSPVHSAMWAMGLELFLQIKDPWQVVLTTDSPNAGPFIRYPRVISWLMSNQRRTEMMDNKEVHSWSHRKTTLGTLDREYDFSEIATITRAAPAKILGFEDRGHLGVGALADIAVYDIEPDNFDPAKNPEAVERAFSNALYTIKDGNVLVKDGEIVKVVSSKHIWTNVEGFEDEEQKVLDQIMPAFNRYYTVKFENYIVHDHFAQPSCEYKVKASK